MGKSESTYTQCYSNFIGADMSSDPRVVARNRLAYSVNMWRDYESENGAAVETFPGFRRVAALKEDDKDVYIINGMHHYKGKEHEHILIHKYNKLYVYNVTSGVMKSESIYTGLNPNGATAFAINNELYFISNVNGTEYNAKMVSVGEDENGEIKAEMVSKYYTPTTYYNGKPYEQRNAFTNKVKQIDSAGGQTEEYEETYKENNIEKERTVEYIAIPLYEQLDSENQTLTVKINGEKANEDTTTETKYPTETKQYKVATRIHKDSEKTTVSATLYFYKSDLYENQTWNTVEIEYSAEPTHFNTVGNLVHFQNDEEVTMAEAILGCTKSAVYDGRVFLTGNPELPNTVFYSQRNSTGANDPTYFGVYNYFNDGDGNTPNVDLLATPSMLMVIKGDTVQDGSVYYHVGADNPHSDESVRNLMPRIYPSTQGAAGLGSAGDTQAYSLSCKFLDDPVFLSRRGLEGVSKEQLNAERTVGHRSSNVDKLLIKEDLAHASMTEWKGYLVICCNGHMYLADSRAISRHQDGSYQYEWFYLEGVGTYREYKDAYRYVSLESNVFDANGISIAIKDLKFDIGEGDGVWGNCADVGFKDPDEARRVIMDEVGSMTAYGQDNVDVTLYYVEKNGIKYPVEPIDEKIGDGDFYGARRVLAVGDLLFFATDFDICVFNTDKRGTDGRIPSEQYSFNGVPYKSACALRLDDCDKKSLTKNTLYGTTAVRLKMMPGSRCVIKSSINGRDWEEIGEAHSTRMDFADVRFDGLAFAEDEDDVTVLPELSRGWINKQYYFESDGFCEPFGLYELSYIYKVAGKIRYI